MRNYNSDMHGKITSKKFFLHNCNRFTFAKSISQVPSTILYSLNVPIFHLWMYLLLKQVQHKTTASSMSRCWKLNTVIHWSHIAFNIFYSPQKKRARSSFFLLEEGIVFMKDNLKVKATERMDTCMINLNVWGLKKINKTQC